MKGKKQALRVTGGDHGPDGKSALVLKAGDARFRVSKRLVTNNGFLYY